MSTITTETMTALAADLTSAVKDIRAARLAFRASIRAIREAGDWTKTEHKSWTTFAADVVSRALPKNTAAIDWTIVAVACAEEGMSVRAIAPVVGKSPAGVSKAIRAAIGSGEAEVPETSTGADGTKRKTARGARSTAAKKSAATNATGSKTATPDTRTVAVEVNEYIAAVGALAKAVEAVKAARPKSRTLTAEQRAKQAKRLADIARQVKALETGLTKVKGDAEKAAA